MDLAKILNVRTLNDYITATETIANKCTNLKVPLNMTTVLNLKKVRSLEIEYFNKCEENGAAFFVFDCMLKQPPSKTWGLLGKELVSMLQYWLDAVRRHLINHSQNWWTFLKALMRCIKEIKTKDPSLLSFLVELTAEGLLDLASHPRPDELQRQQILKTFNEFCAESSRELRSRVRDRLSGYFVKVSAALAASGHAPTQLGALEALLRWLLRRGDARARRAAAAAWFPPRLFAADTVRLFVDRSWRDFYQDARDFLNSHNTHRGHRVTSVVCKKLSVGGVTVFDGPQSRATWLDVNAATRTITIVLTAEVLESAAASSSYETLTVVEDELLSVQLYRTPTETLVGVQTAAPLRLAGGGARALVARVPSARLRALDAALRAAFADKYQVLLNLDTTESSPSSDAMEPLQHSVKKFSSSEEDRRPVIPLRRRKHSGYIVRSRNQLPFNSPSTASTTSLAQLHDKLAALPHIVYNKELVKVSIQPKLSVVSECDERSSISLSQTDRPPRVGVCQRQSNSKLNTLTKKRNFDTETNNKPSSLLLAATFGTELGNESVINDAYEQIYGNNQDIELLDLLVKEAFQNEQDKDSGILTDKKTQDTDFIENTPIEKRTSRKRLSRIQEKSRTKCTVVSNSTTDESNTEFMNEAPCYVSDRKNKAVIKDNRKINEESKLLDAQAVDAFFSQHLSKNTAGQLVISPTLAKKINETSSETSEVILDEYEDLDKNNLIVEVEIMDCLNEIVDEVVQNFEICTQILGKEPDKDINILEMIQDAVPNKNKNERVSNISKENENVTANITPKPVTLRLSSKKSALKRTKQNQKKARGNTVPEAIIEDDVFIENADTNSPVNKSTTPLIRKKRKLYSPKDNDSDPTDEIPLAKLETRKSNVNKTPIATCYKELEKARQTRSRIPRKIRASGAPTISPKTKKLNDIFDKLKEKVDNEEKITQVNTKSKNQDSTIYNFTSDSEDEDFKIKKNEVKKRVISKHKEPTEAKRGRMVDSSTDDNIKKPKKRKIVKPKKSRSQKVEESRNIDLIDERIRAAAPETLEFSFVKDTSSKNNDHVEPELGISHAPVMEPIPNDICGTITEITVGEDRSHKKKRAEILQIKIEKSTNKKTNKGTEILAAKKEKELNKKATMKDVSHHKDSEPGSPLPGLVVETEKTRHDDITASVEATMLQKFNKIYKEAPDIDESDGTPNLLLRTEKYNSPPRRNAVVERNVFDELDTVENISANKPECIDCKAMNQNQNIPDQEQKHTIVLTNSPSEKSIATDGKSPITGHNNFDESPPNMESLKEHIEDRGLEIQDMNQSMAEFFLQLRTRLQNKTPRESTETNPTSPILPTRLPSRERAMPSKSYASTPKTSPCSVRLERLEIKVSPSKSGGSRTPEVVLERMSSDELNKWLPMPMPRRYDIAQEKPKRYNTRMASKKSVMVMKNSPIKKGKHNIKASISPIRLSFDFGVDCDKLSGTLSKDNLDTSYFVGKTSTQMSRELSKNKNFDKNESVKNDSQKPQEIKIIENNQNSSADISEGNNRQDRNIKDNHNKIAAEKGKLQYVHSSDCSKSIASVNAWFKRNIITSSPSKGDTDVGKEILEKVMETLETTLDEIQQETGKNLTSMLVENQKCLNGFREELGRLDAQVVAEIIAVAKEKWAERDRRLKEMMEEFEKGQKKRAIDVARTVHARNNLMVQLLREDLQATLDFNLKNDK